MKVCLVPTGLHSKAMLRVAGALACHAPQGVEIVDKSEEADVQLLHVIGLDGLSQLRAKDYVVIQYCGYVYRDHPSLIDMWRGAKMVWSYYDLRDTMPEGTLFYLAPLGIDVEFAKRATHRELKREIDLMTSGYTTGDAAEAIEEAAWAVDGLGQKMVHLGPKVIENMSSYPACWQAQHGISDATLAELYLRTRWVSGLRHVEGFELPALEGAVCGARPIVFDRPEMRQWYNDFAAFVPESGGEELTAYIQGLLKLDYTPLTTTERRTIRDSFDWRVIAEGFWRGVLSTQKVSVTVDAGARRRLLVVGDACVPTGFAESTHRIIEGLDYHYGGAYDVSVLGINYKGDPDKQKEYPYDVWPTHAGDPFGVTRMKELIEKLGPAAVIIQQDPWNFRSYLNWTGNVPVIGIVAVDGKNCRGAELNGLTSAIFWTKFGEEQAKLGGYTGPSDVVPLGIDLDVYQPNDCMETRERMGIVRALAQRGLPPNTFIVGSVGRNQVRKRLDLTIEYFAEWVKTRNVPDAALWLHVAPTGDDAYDLSSLGKYHGVSDRLMLPSVAPGHGASRETMVRVYSIFSILFSTTVGEGWWLPGMEAMACGIPVVAPDFSAIGEWMKGAALLIPCTSSHCHPPRGISSIGGIADKAAAIDALDAMYHDAQIRADHSQAGLELVRRPEYRWTNIAARIADVVHGVLVEQPVELSELVTA